MPSITPHTARPCRLRSPAARLLLTALALTAAAVCWRPASAAEVNLSGTGSFKPPSAQQLASLPAELAFSRSDLESGKWSFAVRYEDSTPDADPDAYVGRYVGAIRAMHLTVGNTTLELPAEQALVLVSDGGAGVPHRESIRLEARSAAPYGVISVAWVQLHQPAGWADLRGKVGALTSDAMPAPAAMAGLATASRFDRFLQLRIDRPGGESQPLLYLSSSKLSVLSGPAAAP